MNQQLSPSEEQAFAIWLQQNRPEFTGNIVDIDGVVVDELLGSYNLFKQDQANNNTTNTNTTNNTNTNNNTTNTNTTNTTNTNTNNTGALPEPTTNAGALNIGTMATAQPTKIDPALLSYLYFARMGEEANKPGSTLLSSFAGGFQGPAEYLMAQAKSRATGTPGGNVAKVLAQWDNGLVQYLTRDGTMVVKFLNKVYTDPVQIEQLIAKANREANRVSLDTGVVDAEIAGMKKGREGAFDIAKKQADEGLKLIPRLQANIANYQEGISAIDQGAQSGFFVSLLPSIRQSSIELDNVVNRLGLDVVGSVTFGALSAGELSMAMSTAAPTNMQPEYLKKWFEARLKSKSNLLKVTQDLVRFLSGGDKTMQDYYNRKDRLQQEGTWRSTLGLEDVEFSTLDDAQPVENIEPTISPEDQAVIDRIKTMTRDELTAFNTTGVSTSILQAWIARSAQLAELGQ